MNRDEVRLLLHARRPSGGDDDAPAIRAALEHAARDPLLSAELARESRVDSDVARALREVQPPADLRAMLLAGASVQTAVQTPRPWWQRPGTWALAASVALIIGGGAFMLVNSTPEAPPWTQNSAQNLAALRSWVGRDSQAMHVNSKHASRLGDFGAMLENPTQRLLAAELPGDFDAWRAKGCREIDLGGRTVLAVCFRRDRWYHLYVARRADFPSADLDERSTPLVEPQGTATVASWTRGELVYTLATHGDEQALNAVL